MNIGAGGFRDTTNISDPIVAFVLADRGLMYDLLLAGTKISRVVRDRSEPRTGSTSMTDDFNFEGRVALITGGSRGPAAR